MKVKLGNLSPDDVDVQLYYGRVDNKGEVPEASTATLLPSGGPDASKAVLFTGSVPCKSSGQFGFTVRVLPKHKHLPNAFEPGLVTWG